MTNLDAKNLVKEINNISSQCTLVGIKSHTKWSTTKSLDEYLDAFRGGITYTVLLQYVKDSEYNADVVAAVRNFIMGLVKEIAEYTCANYDKIKNSCEVKQLLKEFGWIETFKRIPDLGQSTTKSEDVNSKMAKEAEKIAKYMDEIKNASPKDQKKAIEEMKTAKEKTIAIFDELIGQAEHALSENNAAEPVDVEIVQESEEPEEEHKPEEVKDGQTVQEQPVVKKDSKPTETKGSKKPEKANTKKPQKPTKQQNSKTQQQSAKNQQPVKEKYTAEEAIAETPLGGKLFSPANDVSEEDHEEEVFTGTVEGVATPA